MERSRRGHRDHILQRHQENELLRLMQSLHAARAEHLTNALCVLCYGKGSQRWRFVSESCNVGENTPAYFRAKAENNAEMHYWFCQSYNSETMPGLSTRMGEHIRWYLTFLTFTLTETEFLKAWDKQCIKDFEKQKERSTWSPKRREAAEARERNRSGRRNNTYGRAFCAQANQYVGVGGKADKSAYVAAYWSIVAGHTKFDAERPEGSGLVDDEAWYWIRHQIVQRLRNLQAATRDGDVDVTTDEHWALAHNQILGSHLASNQEWTVRGTEQERVYQKREIP